MQNIIVFISPDIDCIIRDRIIHILSLNHAEITYDINCANLVIQKENLEEAVKKAFEQIKPYEIVGCPIEVPIIPTKKIKHYVPKNIDIKRFNKTRQFNKQTIFNRYKNR